MFIVPETPTHRGLTSNRTPRDCLSCLGPRQTGPSLDSTSAKKPRTSRPQRSASRHRDAVSVGSQWVERPSTPKGRAVVGRRGLQVIDASERDLQHRMASCEVQLTSTGTACRGQVSAAADTCWRNLTCCSGLTGSLGAHGNCGRSCALAFLRHGQALRCNNFGGVVGQSQEISLRRPELHGGVRAKLLIFRRSTEQLIWRPKPGSHGSGSSSRPTVLTRQNRAWHRQPCPRRCKPLHATSRHRLASPG